MPVQVPTEIDAAQSPFTGLPRELRDKVYRELLIPNFAHIFRRHRQRKFEMYPQILRVNKQIHKEAAHVLYEENAWVIIITKKYQGFQGLCKNAKYPVVAYEYLEGYGGNPTLRIEHDSCLRETSFGSSTLVLAKHMQFFCKHFTSYVNIRASNFKLHFDARLQKRPVILKELLEDLYVIRGASNASVTGLDLHSGRKLVNNMRTPLLHTEELIKPVKIYLNRAQRELVNFRYVDAAAAYENGIDFLMWASDWAFFNELPEKEEGSLRLLDQMASTALLEINFCNLEIGNPHEARRRLLNVQERFHGLAEVPKSQKAKALYYTGLTCLYEHEENEALRYFFDTLKIERGHEGADAEIDAMETRIEAIDPSIGLTVKRNLRVVAGAFQHKSGRSLLSEGALDKLLSNFVGEELSTEQGPEASMG